MDRQSHTLQAVWSSRSTGSSSHYASASRLEVERHRDGVEATSNAKHCIYGT